MKRVSLKFSILFLIVILIVSCNNITEIPNTSNNSLKKENFINNKNLDEALLEYNIKLSKHPQRTKEEALSYVKKIYNNGYLRTTNHIKKLSVEYVLNTSYNKLRAKSNQSIYPIIDTLFYIVNINENNGFVIISGDKRVPELLAVIENGSFNKETSMKNNGFKLFFSRIPKYIENTVKIFNNNLNTIKDSIENLGRLRSFNNSYSTSSIVYSDWQETDRTTPLVPVTWGQEDPYNYQIKKVGDSHCPTGCQPVSIAQILATHKNIKKIEDLYIDWDLLTFRKTIPIKYSIDYSSYSNYSKAVDNVSKLLSKIGNMIGVEYNLGGSGSHKNKPIDFFRKIGYKYVSDLKDFNMSEVASSIVEYKLPVLLSGGNGNTGHSWITDGTMTQERTISLYDHGLLLHSHKEQRTLMHFNWGWNGFCNGYYSPDILSVDGIIEKDNPTDIIDNSINLGSSRFQYILLIP